MKKRLLEMLICPSCLPEEVALNSQVMDETGEEIVDGNLSCPQCGKVFPVRKGVAFLDLLSDDERSHTGSKYETAPALASYMWSHYGDLLDEENASDAYRRWAELMRPHPGVAVDAGSAVGRFTFEMSEKSDFAIGVDNSFSFIRSARDLMKNRRMTVHLQQEGLLTREITIELPARWDSEKVEFIVGDAQKMPFRSASVSSFASLNLIDKLPVPLKHLQEMNRIVKEKDVQFLFSDPFSWSTEVAREEDWLGGKDDGRYPGPGINNIISLLERGNGLPPEWKVETHGGIWWTIRTHSNHYELIRSCYVKAGR
jgi:uncharacterized protein YbaR (Trm112 family)